FGGKDAGVRGRTGGYVVHEEAGGDAAAVANRLTVGVEHRTPIRRATGGVCNVAFQFKQAVVMHGLHRQVSTEDGAGGQYGNCDGSERYPGCRMRGGHIGPSRKRPISMVRVAGEPSHRSLSSLSAGG